MINSSGKNKDTQIIKDYQEMVKWIKKNISYQEVGGQGNVKKVYISNTLFSFLEAGYQLIV